MHDTECRSNFHHNKSPHITSQSLCHLILLWLSPALVLNQSSSPIWLTGLKPHDRSIDDWVSWAAKQRTRPPTEFDVPRKGLCPTYHVTFAVGNQSQSRVVLHANLQIWLVNVERHLACGTLLFKKRDPPMPIVPLTGTRPWGTYLSKHGRWCWCSHIQRKTWSYGKECFTRLGCLLNNIF